MLVRKPIYQEHMKITYLWYYQSCHRIVRGCVCFCMYLLICSCCAHINRLYYCFPQRFMWIMTKNFVCYQWLEIISLNCYNWNCAIFSNAPPLDVCWKYFFLHIVRLRIQWIVCFLLDCFDIFYKIHPLLDAITCFWLSKSILYLQLYVCFGICLHYLLFLLSYSITACVI